MIELLAHRFILNHENTDDPSVRRGYASLSGAVGITLNIIVALFKLMAGVFTGSIALLADAANNFADAVSSGVLLVGARLSGRKPDKVHPYGHGRTEFVSGLFISIFVMYMGLELFVDSVKKIMNPTPVEWSAFAFVVLAVSILVKIYMASYNLKISKRFNNPAVRAVAIDSISDSIATTAVFVCGIIAVYTGVDLDAYVGVVIAGLVFYTGINAARGNINPLLGEAPTPEYVARIQKYIDDDEVACGCHDLIVHNYGPGRIFITLHVEVTADGNIIEIHDAIDNLEERMEEGLNALVTIHMDPIDYNNPIIKATYPQVLAIVKEINENLSIHDFRMVSGPTHTNVRFDVFVPVDFKMENEEVERIIEEKVTLLGDHYNVLARIDRNYSGLN